jgi:hypothetical protein
MRLTLRVLSALLRYPDQGGAGMAPELGELLAADGLLSPEQRAALQPLIDDLAAADLLDARNAMSRCSTGGGRCRCTCSNTSTAKAATGARRWSTCVTATKRRASKSRQRTARLPAAVPRIPLGPAARAGGGGTGPAGRDHLRAGQAAGGKGHALCRADAHPGGSCRGGRRSLRDRACRTIQTIWPRSTPLGRKSRSASTAPPPPAPPTARRLPEWSTACLPRNLSGARSMADFIHHLLFGIYPYIALAVLAVGSVIRYDREPYSWRAGSSQLLRRKKLIVGSVLFHWRADDLCGASSSACLPRLRCSMRWASPHGAKQLLAIVAGGVAG